MITLYNWTISIITIVYTIQYTWSNTFP